MWFLDLHISPGASYSDVIFNTAWVSTENKAGLGVAVSYSTLYSLSLACALNLPKLSAYTAWLLLMLPC